MKFSDRCFLISSLTQLNIRPLPYEGRGFDSPFPTRERGWGVRSILDFLTPYLSSYLFLSCLITSFPAQANSIQADTTLSIPSLPSCSNSICTINGGTTIGNNLFHSFSEFSVPTGGAAYFNNPITITNIITRVTGNSISTIDGLLKTNSTANLFLINPNGIIFGANAKLNLGGSFIGSTATSIKFADGSEFGTINPSNPPLLTINVPIGLQMGQNSGAIQVQGSTLQVLRGQTLGLVGQGLTIDKANLRAEDGRIELGSVGGGSAIALQSIPTPRLDYTGVNSFEDIQLTQTLVNTSGASGGGIQLQGDRISVTDATKITADTLGSQNGEGILIRASNLQLDKSLISASTYGAGSAGNLNITATESVQLNGSDQLEPKKKIFAGTFSQDDIRDGLYSVSFGTGAAGNINIKTGQLNGDKAGIFSATFNTGQGGNLNVTASDSVNLSQDFWFSGTTSDGAAGDITITAKNLLVKDLAQINVSAYAENKGQAGNLTVNASESVKLVGAAANDTLLFSGLLSLSRGGNAGNVIINTKQLTIQDGALIGSTTFGSGTSQGRSGDITINASEFLEVTGVTPDQFLLPSVIYVDAFAISDTGKPVVASGDAGTLKINTGRLTIQGGAQITAQTAGTGKGGNLIVNATEVELSGSSPATPQGIAQAFYTINNRFPSSLTTSSLSSGSAGSLSLNTRKLTISDGAAIAVSSVDINSGNAGDLEIQAQSILLDRGVLTATTASGEGGNITVRSQNYLILLNRSGITTSAGGSGNGGNINLTIPFIVGVSTENSDIVANAFQGRGGNINITAQSSFGLEFRPNLTSKSDITASSDFGVNGVVEINTPNINPAQGLTNLPDSPINASQLVTQGCRNRRKQGESGFTITGRGGLPSNPNETLNNETVLSDLRLPLERPIVTTHQSKPIAQINNTPNSALASEILEAQGFVVNKQGQIVLTTEQTNPTAHSAWLHPASCNSYPE